MTNSVPNLRAQRGWTQAISRSSWECRARPCNAIETGRYDPKPLPLAFAIAKLFRRRIEEVFQP